MNRKKRRCIKTFGFLSYIVKLCKFRIEGKRKGEREMFHIFSTFKFFSMTFVNQFPLVVVSSSPLSKFIQDIVFEICWSFNWQENTTWGPRLHAGSTNFFLFRKISLTKKNCFRNCYRTNAHFQPINWTSDMLDRLKSARSHPHEQFGCVFSRIKKLNNF